MNQPFLMPALLRTVITAALAACLLAYTGCRAVSTGRNVDGVRYVQQGQYPVALQRFDAAMTIDPKNPDTYYNKAAVLHRTGLANRDQNALTQAESFYQQCLALNPNHVDCHRGLAVLLTETGRKDQAFTLLRNWTVQSPQSTDAQVELARLYEEYSDPRSAEQALNKALAIDLNNWRALAALGRLREQAGDYAQALQNYQRAYALNRYQPELQTRIAALQSRVGPIPAGAPPAGTSVVGTQSASSATPFRRY